MNLLKYWSFCENELDGLGSSWREPFELLSPQQTGKKEQLMAIYKLTTNKELNVPLECSFLFTWVTLPVLSFSYVRKPVYLFTLDETA